MKLNYKDFNEMTEMELCALPGVGRTTSKRIVGMRPFRNNDDLFKVKGLGKKTLNAVGIEKTKKRKKKWFTIDGVDYPDSALAKDTRYGHIDLFWRIPKEHRVRVGEPSPWILRMRRIDEKTRAEGPDGLRSRYVDNSYMWEPGFKFDWEK
jgi:hypothetical protein|tara:strand:- start:1371 stop:1823 length:453 start_codon:yes stop_codon:yes gene_type:complete